VIASFFSEWIWPAGLNGGTPGDVFGTLEWIVIAAIVGSVLYPPIRRRVEAFVKRHAHEANIELHRKLDHIIEYHPDIPPLPPKDDP
jgi:hypothetical protein